MMDRIKCFRIDAALVKKVEGIIRENEGKWSSVGHFIRAAINRQIREVEGK